MRLGRVPGTGAGIALLERQLSCGRSSWHNCSLWPRLWEGGVCGRHKVLSCAEGVCVYVNTPLSGYPYSHFTDVETGLGGECGLIVRGRAEFMV